MPLTRTLRWLDIRDIRDTRFPSGLELRTYLMDPWNENQIPDLPLYIMCIGPNYVGLFIPFWFSLLLHSITRQAFGLDIS